MLSKKRKNHKVAVLSQKIKKIEKKNPKLVQSIELFDLSMEEYEKALRSLHPIKTYTSNATIARL